MLNFKQCRGAQRILEGFHQLKNKKTTKQIRTQNKGACQRRSRALEQSGSKLYWRKGFQPCREGFQVFYIVPNLASEFFRGVQPIEGEGVPCGERGFQVFYVVPNLISEFFRVGGGGVLLICVYNNDGTVTQISRFARRRVRLENYKVLCGELQPGNFIRIFCGNNIIVKLQKRRRSGFQAAYPAKKFSLAPQQTRERNGTKASETKTQSDDLGTRKPLIPQHEEKKKQTNEQGKQREEEREREREREREKDRSRDLEAVYLCWIDGKAVGMYVCMSLSVCACMCMQTCMHVSM